MKHTIQQKIVAALENSDVAERNYSNQSSRYIIFDTKANPDIHLYVGKKGAVRIGRTISSSIPVQSHRITEWIDIGTELLENK